MNVNALSCGLKFQFVFFSSRTGIVVKKILLRRSCCFLVGGFFILFLATQVDMLIIFETQRIDVAILKFELKSVGF